MKREREGGGEEQEWSVMWCEEEGMGW